MKSAPFRYHRPETLDELAEVLAALENARILAGGQSLMAMLNMRYVQVDDIVDINRVRGLAGVRNVDGWLEIGAMTRQVDLARSDAVRQHSPLLLDALRNVGHLQTRNRGTIGGSLCHLDPAAELPACCLALDATLVVASAVGEREVGAEDWFLGYMTPNLEPHEFLRAIRIPPGPDRASHAFLEFSRRRGDFALASIACRLGFEEDGRVSQAALVVAGLDVRPARLREAEALLAGRHPDDAILDSAARTLKDLEVMADAYGDAAYRRHLAGVLAGRCLRIALARAFETDREVLHA